MSTLKESEWIPLVAREDIKGAEIVQARVRIYQRQKAKQRQKGMSPADAVGHEELRAAISYHFGETTAIFFDRHERLPYDRKSILGWSMSWAERRGISRILGLVFAVVWVFSHGVLYKLPSTEIFDPSGKYVFLASGSTICALLLVILLIVVWRKFPPRNVQQREQDYEQMKHARMECIKRRSDAAEKARAERLAKDTSTGI